MTSTELASNISLNPRAVVLTGTFQSRTKDTPFGRISGTTPHYITKGSPPVSAGPQPEGVGIESVFNESTPFLSQIETNLPLGRVQNFVSILHGASGNPPNNTTIEMMTEAGQVIGSLEQGRTPCHMVALPAFHAAQYGATGGRLFCLGIFDGGGKPLWLHPAAQGKLLTAKYPETQKIRSLAAVAAPPTTLEWYETLASGFQGAMDRNGVVLHNTVLKARARFLVTKGNVTSEAEGLAAARKEYESVYGTFGTKKKDQAGIEPPPQQQPEAVEPPAQEQQPSVLRDRSPRRAGR